LREVFARLRAALTPQVVLLFVLMALFFFSMSSRQDHSLPLENRIARTLSAMDGAGRVEVTIRTREITSSSGMLSSNQTQQIPCGAVAVAQGADDPLVAIKLQEALCSLLALPPSSVSVITGGK